MKSIYSKIMFEFNKQVMLPILSIGILLLLVLFLMNEYKSDMNKQALTKTTKMSFINLAKSSSMLITDRFNHEKNTLTLLQKTLEQNFKYNVSLPKILIPTNLTYTKGFFEYKNISLYTTNLNKLNKHDFSMLNALLYSYSYMKKTIVASKDLISSGWINIGAKYALAFPRINISKGLSSNLDVTKYSFYYLANNKHNPSKGIIFIPLYAKAWAVKLGEIGGFIAPIYVNSNMIGVVGFTLHVNVLQKIITSFKLPKKEFAFIVDKQNHIIVSSNEMQTQNIFHVSSFYKNYLRQNNSLTLQNISLVALKNRYIFQIVKIPNTSLRLIIASKTKNVFKEIIKLHKQAIYIGVFILFLMLIFFIYLYIYAKKRVHDLAYDISKPLNQIVQFSNSLGKEIDFKIEDSHISELSLLINNLNKTHKKLLEMIVYDEQTHIYNKRKLIHDLDDIDTLMFFCVDNYSDLQYLYGDILAIDLLMGIVKEISKEPSITPYRIKEDTFALAIKGFDSNKLYLFCSALKLKKIKCNNIRLYATIFASIANRRDSQDILKDVELALMYAKNNKISSFVTYQDAQQIKDEFDKNIKWSSRLSDAFLENRLEAYYQPVYDIKNRKIDKFEALVRLNENGKVISPYFFLEAAKNMGRIHDITLFMIKSVLQTASRYKDISFNINLSFKDFDDSEFLDYVKGTCEFYHVNPKNITFELLETDALENIDTSIQAVDKLKEMGFSIAIDDFGTGNSNFAHLMTMNVDYIKIDGQFIQDIADNSISKHITSTIIQFSKLVGAKTVAEFVCNDEVLEIVKSMGINYAQGYTISKPVRVSELDDLIVREF